MSFLTKLKFYAKSFVFGSLILVCALYGVVASIVLRIAGKEEFAQYTVARAFYYLFSKVLGIKISIRNEAALLNRPSVVISNHQSALDILILGRIFQPGYTVTAKKDLKYFPFLGWFMLALGTFFIDRARGEKARKVLESGLCNLRDKKRSIFMFPEGTRSATKKLELLPFKKGAFHLAKQAKIPVVPVAVSNYSTIFHSGDKIFNQGEIIIDVFDPISTENVETNEDVTQLVEEAREKMLKSIESMGYASTRAQLDAVPEPASETHRDDESAESVEILESTPLLGRD